MNVDVKDLGSGWFEIGIGLTASDIQLLIEHLQRLQEQRENFDHFHFRSAFAGSGGVSDVEIYRAEEGAPKNMIRTGRVAIETLGVSLMNMSLSVHLHGAKFYEHKTAALESDPRLPVKNGPGRSDCDPQSDQRHYRQPDREQERDHGQVDKSFPFRQRGRQFLARARGRRKRRLGIAAMNPCHFGKKTSNLGGLFFSIDRRVWRPFAQRPLHCDYAHNWCSINRRARRVMRRNRKDSVTNNIARQSFAQRIPNCTTINRSQN